MAETIFIFSFALLFLFLCFYFLDIRSQTSRICPEHLFFLFVLLLSFFFLLLLGASTCVCVCVCVFFCAFVRLRSYDHICLHVLASSSWGCYLS